MDFHQFVLRGKEKVKAEWLLLSLTLNVLKIHHNIQNNHLGTALMVPKSWLVYEYFPLSVAF